MYEDVKGKRLLILGAYASEIEIVNAARKMGVYTITTDNHTNWDDAPAKKVSDEAWDISWSDMDTLAEKCRESHVDGIMAGFSERRVNYAAILSNMINTHFYAGGGTKLNTIFSKSGFKQACIDSGIRVPQNYSVGSPVKFPVIVKPADNGGSRGITICYTQPELDAAVAKALSFSDKGEVLIEEYLTCDEIMVYFTVHNGTATLSAMCDRYMHRFHENITQLPVGYYFPSKYLGIFIEHNLEKFRRLIKNLGISDGLIAFQSFVRGNDVMPFDPTYRMDGTMAYHMIEHRNGINVVELLIRKSLTGSMGDDTEIQRLENPYFSAPAFELPILLGKGTITRVEGLEEVEAMPDVVFVSRRDKILGAVMEKPADFTQMLCRVHICAENNAKILQNVQEIYSSIRVFDENGKDMVIWRNTFTLS